METSSEIEKKNLIKLKQKLLRKAKVRGFDVTDEDISDEIEDAIDFVNNRRGFQPTSDCLYEKKYNSIIVELALYAISKYGAEGEVAHSENGISRSYENGSGYPRTLARRITPLAGTPNMEE